MGLDVGGGGASSKILGSMPFAFSCWKYWFGTWLITLLMPTASQERSQGTHLAPPSPHPTPTHLVLKSSAASLALSIWTTSLLFSALTHRIWGKKGGSVSRCSQIICGLGSKEGLLAGVQTVASLSDNTNSQTRTRCLRGTGWVGGTRGCLSEQLGSGR